jgi:hypothetical protein
VKFGALDMDPAKSPGVLDTATWNPAAVLDAVRAVGERWRAVQAPAPAEAARSLGEGVSVAGGSVVRRDRTVFFVARLPDRQEAILAVGPGDGGVVLGEPLGVLRLADGQTVSVHPASATVLDRYCRALDPINAPRALGATPRLGVGVRMTTAVWPGLFDAMERRAFAANSIQNSVRELNLLDDLLAGRPAPTNYACGFGTIETGYTGSSFEGLWVSGVLAALHRSQPLRYGADADHVQVKRADGGWAWAQRVLEAARHYTFYTLDVSDVLDYRAVQDPAWAEARFAERFADGVQRRDLLAWHRDTGDAGRVVGFATKYASAFDAVATLRDRLGRLKNGQPYDLELSIDEHPPEIAAFDCLTTSEEARFVLREAQRRGIALTHIAPNVGVEKGRDFRHPAGLDGLRRRVEALHRLAESHGCMLDIHSADDLGPEVRRTLRAATGGRLHYKISPSVQLLFADVLRDVHPELYGRWWRDAETYAKREADAGSRFAAECLAAECLAAERPAGGGLPSPWHPVFHQFSFAFVGRRGSDGRFLNREEFYGLSPAFSAAYRARMADHLARLAAEVLGDGQQ